MPSKSSAKTEPKASTRPAALSDGDGRREARRLDRPLSFSSGSDGFSGQEAPDVVSAGTDQILSGDEAAAKRARFSDRRRAKRKQEAGKSTAVKKLRRTGPSDKPGVGGGGDGEPAAELGRGESTSDGSSSGSEESSDESEESDHQDEDDEDDEGYGETGFKDPFTCEFCPEKCLESKSQLEAHLGSKRHLQRVKEAEENPGGKEVYHCSACPTKEMRTEKDVDAHLASAQHLKNAKRLAAKEQPRLTEEERQKRVAKNMKKKEKRMAEKKRKTKELLKEKKKASWLRRRAESAAAEKA